MVLVVLGIVLFVLSFVIKSLDRHTSDKANLHPTAWLIRSLGAVMMVGGALWAMITIVPAGHRAVLLRFGAVQGQLDEGIHLIVPAMDTVQLMEVRTQKEESQASAASSDLQVVSTTLALNFRVDPSKVSQLYQSVGTEYRARIIDPAVQESIKVVTAKYTAESLIRERAQVKEEVETEITKRLADYDIIVNPGGLSITNFEFSPEFNRAIEAKQVAQQQAEQQKYVLQRAELEKDTAIAKAEGEAKAAELNAEALRVQGGSLVVAREWITKWDGRLPQVSGAGNYIIDLQSLLKSGQ
ncbi:MAG TPA: prohibitin family protein [Fimbriimonadaceae bacterium]|nr:prohibitin family protein [Fimbriimonadaceae bacterium]